MAISWDELNRECNSCSRCKLCSTRTNVVIGDGNPNAKIMFVGEGPGRQEDEQGIPFVGDAGKLLRLALDAIGFDKNDYYIANVVKCRPPENRNPEEDECTACLPYLRAQYALIRPKIVCCLGNIALKHMIDPNASISKFRGSTIQKGGSIFTATYHPAMLLRKEDAKPEFMADLIKVKEMADAIND